MSSLAHVRGSIEVGPAIGMSALHADRLRLGVAQDALGALTAAETGLAHAAHRGVDAAERRGEALVDVDRAGLDARRRSPWPRGACPRLALRPYSPPLASAIGVLGRLVRIERHQRAERLTGKALGRLGDALEDGRLVEVRAEVRATLAAREDRRTVGDGVLDVCGDGLELRLRDQRADVGIPVEGGAEREVLDAGHEGGPELLEALLGHVEALDRDAQLAGRREARLDGTRGGLVDVGAGQHDHRVLAAELERAADQPGRSLLGDELAGRGRAGEADVVGALDDRGADD